MPNIKSAMKRVKVIRLKRQQTSQENQILKLFSRMQTQLAQQIQLTRRTQSELQ